MRALDDVEVLVVDCQTTGSSPTFGSVLELGFGVTRANRPEADTRQAHWIALPEGQVVPRQVQKMTGYQPLVDSHEAISDRDAWQRLRDAVRLSPAMPTVIHFARFELAFLRDWSTRFEPDTPFPLDAVCLHAVACRLFPNLPRQSLRALAGHLGHGLHLTRRSLGHVEATTFVWRKLCASLAARGISSWEQLQTFLTERVPPRSRHKKPQYPFLVTGDGLGPLPDDPGVYRFLRANGDVLYVGKAASLKKRISSHFSARAGKQLAAEMLTQVSDIRVSVAASPLEAALLEHATIEALRPPYNVQLVPNDSRVWYSSRNFDAARHCPDERHPIGPVASEYSLRALGALMTLVAGSPPSSSLRTHAVGVSALFTPDDEVFAAGWAEFVARHPGEVARALGAPRDGTLRLARKLLLKRAPTRPADDDRLESTAASEKPDGWTPERVADHLEGATAQAYQTYRRARWLRLLHDSDISYREPKWTRGRHLRFRGGELIEASDAPMEPRSSVVPACPTPHLASFMPFDRKKYDRLRVLNTELKRICRDGGAVTLYRASGTRISPRCVAVVVRLV